GAGGGRAGPTPAAEAPPARTRPGARRARRRRGDRRLRRLERNVAPELVAEAVAAAGRDGGAADAPTAVATARGREAEAGDARHPRLERRLLAARPPRRPQRQDPLRGDADPGPHAPLRAGPALDPLRRAAARRRDARRPPAARTRARARGPAGQPDRLGAARRAGLRTGGLRARPSAQGTSHA